MIKSIVQDAFIYIKFHKEKDQKNIIRKITKRIVYEKIWAMKRKIK